MADSSESSAPEGETANQRQARLRREKRQQRMAEQGEDRLARIKALNGGVAPPAEVLGGPTAGGESKQATVEDPDEVDIDTVSGTGTPSGRPARGNAEDNPLAAAMLQMQQGQKGQAGGADGSAEDDPMVKMMQQITGLMGGNPQNPNDPNQQPEIPPMLQALMGGGRKEQQKAPETGSAYLWRIVHTLFAFTLAIYITMTSTFNGSKLARSQSVYTDEAGYGFGPRLFIIFTSVQLLLQSTRYFLEKGQLQGSGMFATVANSGMVPEPYAHYIRTAGRYVGILRTIISDAMVVVFVFGALAWWRGMAAA